MKDWCKIIPLEEVDVLVERISNEQDKEAIRCSMRVNGMHLVAVMGFEEDGEKADAAYEKYDKAGAEEFLDNILKMMESNG